MQWLARPAASWPALREGVAATLATRSTRATTMLTKTMDRLSMLHMLSMLMGMLPAKEAMGMLHTTNTDGKSTHDAHEDGSETCGAPLDAGACFCSNLLDFVNLHKRSSRDSRRASPSHAHPCARAHTALRSPCAQEGTRPALSPQSRDTTIYALVARSEVLVTASPP